MDPPSMATASTATVFRTFSLPHPKSAWMRACRDGRGSQTTHRSSSPAPRASARAVRGPPFGQFLRHVVGENDMIVVGTGRLPVESAQERDFGVLNTRRRRALACAGAAAALGAGAMAPAAMAGAPEAGGVGGLVP